MENDVFLPWGKMEMFWQGRLVGRLSYWFWRAFFTCTGPILRSLVSETFLRGVRRRVTRVLGRRVQPNHWVIECTSERAETLFAAIANSLKEELLVRRLDLLPGQNYIVIQIPESIPDEAFFRIYSIDGTAGRVVFNRCEVGRFEKTRSLPSVYVKCVAWDLDNTLWKGVLADDGVEHLEVRVDVVDAIKEFDRRGILNTICSKNDYETAWAALKKFGLADYFVFPEINWNPKSENLKHAAKKINIGLDSFAFVDDSEHERGEVRENLPMIRVYGEQGIDEMLSFPEFNPPISNESSMRRLSYLAEMARSQDETRSGGSHVDFLRRCNIRIQLIRPKSDDLRRRCWELVNRTNQLTLAAHRYSEAEFWKLIDDSSPWAIRCQDKYGDYGVVGFVSKKGDEIREFVMSCRVAKKFCEQSVLLHLADKARAEGQNLIYADVVATGRNAALIEAFDAMPFEKVVFPGYVRYSLSLDQPWNNVYMNEVVDEEMA